MRQMPGFIHASAERRDLLLTKRDVSLAPLKVGARAVNARALEAVFEDNAQMSADGRTAD
jgi:hypothetical protein